MRTNSRQILSIIFCMTIYLVTDAQPFTRKMPPGLKVADVDKHTMRPTHVINVSSDDDKFENLAAIPRLKPNTFKANVTPKANWNEFMDEIHKALKDSVQGYILQINKNGANIGGLKWSWAKSVIDGSQGWDANTRMHIASISKYLTALGVLKALKLKGLTPDTKIISYLPSYWPKGNNIDKITFSHLLTHRSGFTTGGSGSDFLLMKSKVAGGVSNVGEGSGYENMNFGLCRILIPVVMGLMDKDDQGGDLLWDMVSVGWFKSFMQDKIFTPSGVPNVGFDPSAGYKSANAYMFPFPTMSQSGWNSGNLYSVAGGAGFRLSVAELLKVVDHARRKGDILPTAEVQDALDKSFGINGSFDTPAGKAYYRKGRWTAGDGRTEQSVLVILPDNIEVVVFVNSYIGKAQSSIYSYVKNIYLNSFQ